MDYSGVTYRTIKNFDDISCQPTLWNDLLKQSTANVIFMTWEWQKTWWEVFGRGELMIIVAELNGKPFALAPFFAEEGMIYLVGSGGSDYLDFIGELDGVLMQAMLRVAADQTHGFLGFVFYHIPEESKTKFLLEDAAIKLDFECYREGEMISPMIRLLQHPGWIKTVTRKKSLLRHEGWFKKNGVLTVKHLLKAEEVLPVLDDFFKQHIERWEVTEFPSMFLDSKQQLFFKKLTVSLATKGWLRFTMITWENTLIACHFGFNYEGCFFWYKPTFNLELAKKSPGEVLLRQLLLQAEEEQAHTFDFGLGDESFKKRFATDFHMVENRGLYPKTK